MVIHTLTYDVRPGLHTGLKSYVTDDARQRLRDSAPDATRTPAHLMHGLHVGAHQPTIAAPQAQAAAAAATAEVMARDLARRQTNEQVKITQQVINYLDCIKDGTAPANMIGLNIFPLGQRVCNNGNTCKHLLHQIENRVIYAHKDNITKTWWRKLKPGRNSQAELNNSKVYDQILWEAGLGPKYFCMTADGAEPKSINTFGSYIDPLEKNNADKTWPDVGGEVVIDEAAMQYMGFPNCSLWAKTGGNNTFEFEMSIGTGQSCTAPLKKNRCTITHLDPSFNKYFAGNKFKNAAVGGPGAGLATNEKVKLIMVKEWGDKMQCLIYLLKQMSGDVKTSVMSSCDKVVYILCLLLKVPFIYTGYDDDNDDGRPEYKHYAISHYQPNNAALPDPTAVKRTLLLEAREKVTDNNINFTFFLEGIDADDRFFLPDGKIMNFTFGPDGKNAFIKGCNADILALTKRATDELDEKIQQLRGGGGAGAGAGGALATSFAEMEMTQCRLEIADIKIKYTVVPFINVKKGGGEKDYAFTRTHCYTLRARDGATNVSQYYLVNNYCTQYGKGGVCAGGERSVVRAPFFKLMQGEGKEGANLNLLSPPRGAPGTVIQQGGSKYKQVGGDPYKSFRGEPQPNLAAESIGWIPDPRERGTWEKYTVSGKDGKPPLVSDLEANLIEGIIAFCEGVGDYDLGLFASLYTTTIYQGVLTAALPPVEANVVVVAAEAAMAAAAAAAAGQPPPQTPPANLFPFPEYERENPIYFFAALITFFGSDGPLDGGDRPEETKQMLRLLQEVRGRHNAATAATAAADAAIAAGGAIAAAGGGAAAAGIPDLGLGLGLGLANTVVEKLMRERDMVAWQAGAAVVWDEVADAVAARLQEQRVRQEKLGDTSFADAARSQSPQGAPERRERLRRSPYHRPLASRPALAASLLSSGERSQLKPYFVERGAMVASPEGRPAATQSMEQLLQRQERIQQHRQLQQQQQHRLLQQQQQHRLLQQQQQHRLLQQQQQQHQTLVNQGGGGGNVGRRKKSKNRRRKSTHKKIKKRKYTRRRRRNYTSKKRSRKHNRIKRKYKIHLTRKHKK